MPKAGAGSISPPCVTLPCIIPPCIILPCMFTCDRSVLAERPVDPDHCSGVWGCGSHPRQPGVRQSLLQTHVRRQSNYPPPTTTTSLISIAHLVCAVAYSGGAARPPPPPPRPGNNLITWQIPGGMPLTFIFATFENPTSDQSWLRPWYWPADYIPSPFKSTDDEL